MSSNTTVAAIGPKPHHFPQVVESAIEIVKNQDLKELAFQSLGTIVSLSNPFSRLEQHDRQLKLMDKSIKVKKAIIRDAEKKARQFKSIDPKKAEGYQNIADKLKLTLEAQEAKREYVAIDKDIERLGKFSIISNKVIPGSGMVLTTAYSVGKIANAALLALSPNVEMNDKIQRVKEVSKDLALTGALVAGGILSAYAWSLIG